MKPFTKCLALGLAMTLAGAGASASGSEPLTLAKALEAAATAAPPGRHAAARVEAIRHFHDAIVADLEYAAANEQVAVTYVAFDRARARAGPASPSDIGVKELELRYALALERRQGCLSRQRIARQALASIMGSRSPPAELVEPAAPAAVEALPDLASLEQRIAGKEPGSRTDTARIPERDRFRLALLEAALDVERLRRTSLPRAEREVELADLRVEKARGDLEAGRAAELGAAMASTAEAAFRRAKARAELATALARLEELAGSPAY